MDYVCGHCCYFSRSPIQSKNKIYTTLIILFMKQITINRTWAFSLGTMLVIPTAYFIFIALLKYGLGVPFLFDSAQPLLERLGIKDSLGWNINLLILFGPLIAMVLNLFAVLTMEWYNEKEDFSVK